MKEAIRKRINRAISEKVFPGCVIGYIRRGEKVVLPFGKHTYELDSRRVAEDSVYDIASVTKSIPTSSLALHYLDSGKLRLDDRVNKYIEGFNSSYSDLVLVRHLLTHTLPFADLHLSHYKDSSPEEILSVIKNFKLDAKPGTRYVYANTNSILLGMILERISGKTLPAVSHDLFFGPLNMHKTTFFPETFEKRSIVPTEYDDWRGKLIHGEVHDESAWKLGKNLKVGSAGLFSNVPDLLVFLEMLLSQGTVGEKRYLSENVINQIFVNQTPNLTTETGLGWELNQKWFMGKYAGKVTFGKTGFTGCSVVCNIPKAIALVILSNRIHPTRGAGALEINELRRDISDIVFRP